MALESPTWSPPPDDTLESWAYGYVTSCELREKFALAPPPREVERDPPCRRDVRPGRPPELLPANGKTKTPGPEALRAPASKARLAHKFLHHELQAAELMCWAILAYPTAPEKFRRGLAHIARDEVRHMCMYRDYLETLGYSFGDFPVRDWFWDRVPGAESPAHFVATMGMGFEGGNLDHTRRFAERFRAIDDGTAARLTDTISEEEIPHVHFAITWFKAFTGSEDFESWIGHLPPPLSPMVMRGTPLDRGGRQRAGFSARFVHELMRWESKDSGF